MKELYPAQDNSPNVALCSDGRVRIKTVGVRAFKGPDGNKDYQSFWCYRLPKSRADHKAARAFNSEKD